MSPRDEEAPREGPEQAPEPEADAEAQQQVSRLLAAAAEAQGRQMPVEVAERLDAVLAGLVAEREGQSPPADGVAARAGAGSLPADQVAGVTELSSRRRRRGPRLLVAAAAISVLALGVGVRVEELTGGGSDSTTAESARSTGGASQQERSSRESAAEPGQAPADGLTTPRPSTGRPGDEQRGFSSPVPVRTTTLRSDLQRIEDSGVALPVASSARRWREACVQPETAAGEEWLPVRLDGRPGVLVLRAPQGGRRTGDVFVCGSPGSPAASATVEAR